MFCEKNSLFCFCILILKFDLQLNAATAVSRQFFGLNLENQFAYRFKKSIWWAIASVRRRKLKSLKKATESIWIQINQESDGEVLGPANRSPAKRFA